MRHYPFKESTEAPVSHDPGLSKRVLATSPTPSIRRISRIELKPGQTVSGHAHPDDYEVFYSVSGAMTVSVDTLDLVLSPGDVLVVEPGERHAILDVAEPSSLLYMRVAAK